MIWFAIMMLLEHYFTYYIDTRDKISNLFIPSFSNLLNSFQSVNDHPYGLQT